jgi:23S rRNA (uracil1939-C5)-methyltransferase
VNERLIAAVMESAGIGVGTRVLDLYAGAGNFALPAAGRGAQVQAVERDPTAVAAGRANAGRLGLAVTFRCASVADALADVAADSVDAVILDPPRTGAPEAMASLAALRAPRVVYVSCDPATLARDLRALVASGYRVARVEPVDLFPQTYHIESVAELRLT